MAKFEPRIIAFLCNGCTYTGADLAGTSRLRLMCSGGLDPVHVLKSVVEGADGVLIGGCHPGDCHYQSGNYKARRRFAILQSTLDTSGTGLAPLDQRRRRSILSIFDYTPGLSLEDELPLTTFREDELTGLGTPDRHEFSLSH